ncbi:hypothetical protein HY993_00845 [Candidatus Micrarchaeota archaeon]|nr:hypothetical protein [Candidatus Micrarchaeota archaeon]
MLDKKTFDLILGFVVREERYLKNRETSIPSSELDEGRKRVKKIIATARKKAGNKLAEVLSKQGPRSKLSKSVASANRGVPAPQVKLIMDNFDVFAESITESKGVIEKRKANKKDRFYTPKHHDYV